VGVTEDARKRGGSEGETSPRVFLQQKNKSRRFLLTGFFKKPILSEGDYENIY
jgi:hypothetical protein